MPGDVLVIPPVGPQVAVIGPERLQAIYEIKDAHETVGDVVQYGGGLPVLTSRHLALLERLDPNRVPARNMRDMIWTKTAWICRCRMAISSPCSPSARKSPMP